MRSCPKQRVLAGSDDIDHICRRSAQPYHSLCELPCAGPIQRTARRIPVRASQPEVICAISRRACANSGSEQQRVLERITRGNRFNRGRVGRGEEQVGSAAPQPGRCLGVGPLDLERRTAWRSFTSARSLCRRAVGRADSRSCIDHSTRGFRPPTAVPADVPACPVGGVRGLDPFASRGVATACGPQRQLPSAKSRLLGQRGVRLAHAALCQLRRGTRRAPPTRSARRAAQSPGEQSPRNSRAACRAIHPQPLPSSRAPQAGASSVVAVLNAVSISRHESRRARLKAHAHQRAASALRTRSASAGPAAVRRRIARACETYTASRHRRPQRR